MRRAPRPFDAPVRPSLDFPLVGVGPGREGSCGRGPSLMVGVLAAVLLLTSVMVTACDEETTDPFRADLFGIFTWEVISEAHENGSWWLTELVDFPWDGDAAVQALAAYIRTVRGHVWGDTWHVHPGASDIAGLLTLLEDGEATARVSYTHAGTTDQHRWLLTVPPVYELYGETKWKITELRYGRSGSFGWVNKEAQKFVHCAGLDIDRRGGDDSLSAFDEFWLKWTRYSRDYECWYEKPSYRESDY